jgi:Ca2+/Na+ antiporter
VTAAIDLVRRHVALLGLALAVPLITALAAVRSPRWYPAGDFAQAEMHVRAVPRDMPLVGAAARVGTILDQGSHPGPGGAVALTVPYRLLGSSGWSLMAATVVVHLVAMTAAIVVGRRVGGVRVAALLAVVCAVMLRAFGPSWFLEPWNPWLGVFALLAVVVLVWAVWRGQVSVLPWLVVAASFCAQVHLGYGLIIAGLGVAVIARLVVLARRNAYLELRRPLLLSVVVAALAWMPSVIDELTREPGNLTRLWRHFGDPPEELAGLRRSFTAFVNEFNLFGTWSLGRDRQPTDSPDVIAWIGFLAMVALVAVSVLIVRRLNDTALRDGWSVGLIVIGLALSTLTRIFGPIYDYIIRWMAVVTAFTVVLCLWTLWTWWSRRRTAEGEPPSGRTIPVVLAAVAGVALAAASVSALDAEVPLPRDSRITAELARQTRDGLDTDTTYLIRFHDPVSLGAPGIGLLNELERQGVDVGVDTWLSANVQPHRTMTEDDADVLLLVVIGDPAIEAARSRDGAVDLADVPMDAADAALSQQLRSQVEAALSDIGRADLIDRLDEQYGVSQVEAEPGLPAEVLHLVARYRALRLPAAVIAVPAGTGGQS